MQKLVKESEYFLAWLVFQVCTTVGGAVLGGVAGGVLGGILGGAGVDLNSIKWICGGTGILLGFVLSFFFFRLFVDRMIVKKAEMRAAELLLGSRNQEAADVARLPPGER